MKFFKRLLHFFLFWNHLLWITSIYKTYQWVHIQQYWNQKLYFLILYQWTYQYLYHLWIPLTISVISIYLFRFTKNPYLIRFINYPFLKMSGSLIFLGMIGSWGFLQYQEDHARHKNQPNILLISIDTLRADHLGCYGYHRNTTPHLDQLSKNSYQFINTFSQAPWTLPSMSSIHTGLYPSEHGANAPKISLSPKKTTIAEILKNCFYKTIAISSHIYVSDRYGFSQGFDIFNEKFSTLQKSYSSHLIADQTIDYLNKFQDERFFLWVHFFDPHYVYLEHESFKFSNNYQGNLKPGTKIDDLREIRNQLSSEDIQYLVDLYDSEIAFTDHHIGRILDFIHSSKKLSSDTLIVIVSDHGEEFMERDWLGHTNSLYNEQIRVPLIIHLPNQNNNFKITQPVETRQILPTILQLTHNDYKIQTLFDNNSLPILDNHQNPSLFSEVDFPKKGEKEAHLRALIENDHKLILNLSDGNFSLYQWTQDSQEIHNLMEKSQTLAQQLKEHLNQILKELFLIYKLKNIESKELNLSEEESSKLKSLGYL